MNYEFSNGALIKQASTPAINVIKYIKMKHFHSLTISNLKIFYFQDTKKTTYRLVTTA